MQELVGAHISASGLIDRKGKGEDEETGEGGKREGQKEKRTVQQMIKSNTVLMFCLKIYLIKTFAFSHL